MTSKSKKFPNTVIKRRAKIMETQRQSGEDEEEDEDDQDYDIRDKKLIKLNQEKFKLIKIIFKNFIHSNYLLLLIINRNFYEKNQYGLYLICFFFFMFIMTFPEI
jgi:hypothetical protein